MSGLSGSAGFICRFPCPAQSSPWRRWRFVCRFFGPWITNPIRSATRFTASFPFSPALFYCSIGLQVERATNEMRESLLQCHNALPKITSMKIDIIIVYIPRYVLGHEKNFVPPLTGIHLAALTPSTHSVRVIHQQLQPVDLETDADVIALSFFSGFAPEADRKSVV